MTVNKKYTDHYLRIDEIFPSVLALKLFLGNNPIFTFRDHNLNNKKILDIGFGDGRDLYLFHKLKMQVFGIEVDPLVVKHTSSKFKNKGLSITLKTGTNNNTGFNKNFFDIIYASASIYYLVDEFHRIQESYRHCWEILKEGGYFVGSLARFDAHTTVGAHQLDANRLILEDPFYKFRKGQYYHVYNSQDEIKKDLVESGFEIITINNYDVDWFGTRETLYLFIAKKVT
tara:strand:- start:82 stop:768 length:687 start_codon:yes stop_codon:yes gene_type:complete